MSQLKSDELLERAISAGLLPPSAELAAKPERPWPLVMLTALGAWLAAVPLLIFTYTMLGDALTRGAGPYVVGALMLTAAIIILRSASATLFLEQLAVPALCVGASTLALGLYRDLDASWASAMLMLAALGLAALIAKPWLRALLGAAAATFFGLALLPSNIDHLLSPSRLWLIVHAGLVLGVAALILQQRYLLQGQDAAKAAFLEALSVGWLAMLLFGLALVASLGHSLWGSPSTQTSGLAGTWASSVASMALALLGFALAARAWPALRHPLTLGVALVLAGLCLWLPMLGGALLLLAFGCSTRRWHLAVASTFAAAWVLAASYYQLSWSLTDKALVLLGAAGLLALMAWLTARDQDKALSTAVTSPQATRMPGGAWVLMAGLLGLAIVNTGIWQKQRLIADGRPIFVALAPVDPRSLMQGDYMRLNYELGSDVDAATLYRLGAERPRLVLKLDQRGLGVAQRLHEEGAPLAADEQLIELSPKNGGWTLVSDAWFFREGDAQRWQAAKYGEFRVRADGQALLVGLADAQLKRIEP